METFNGKIFSFNKMYFLEQKTIFQQLDIYIKPNNKNIYLCVSGGPDSMFIVFIIFYYFLTSSLDMSRIYICHFNHKQRKVSDDEANILKKYFMEQKFILGKYSGKGKTEKSRRDARRKFLENCKEKYGEGIFITGHNLSDRIETTFLNLLRGTHREGIANMSFFDTKNKRCILRPLINFSKKTICLLCKKNNIPYFIDKSNNNKNLSRRNNIRHILKQYAYTFPENTLENNFKKFYFLLERKKRDKKNLFIEKLTPSIHWKCDQYISFMPPKNIQIVYNIFKYCQTLSGVSLSTLQEFYSLFQKKSGRKYIQGWYFFISHGKGYGIKCSKKNGISFWRNNLDDFCFIAIDGSWCLGDQKGINKEYVGKKVRFAMLGDRYHSKLLKKWMINKKIPIFWRNYIPLLVNKKNEIKAILLKNKKNW